MWSALIAPAISPWTEFPWSLELARSTDCICTEASGGRTWVHPCTASHRFLDFESKLPCRGCFARVIWACVPGPVERKSERKSDYGPVRATLHKRSTSIHCKKKLDARYVYVVYVRVTTCVCCCFSRALERRKLGTL